MIDRCFRAREGPLRSPYKYVFPTDLIFNWIYCALLVFKSSYTIRKLKQVWLVQGIYFAFGFIVFFSKGYLQDPNCHTIANSVSSHAFFDFFFLLCWSNGFHQTQYKAGIFDYASFTINIFLHVVDMALTYLGGFHSLRQILYGMGFAVLAFLFSVATKNLEIKKSYIIVTVISVIFGGLCYLTEGAKPDGINFTVPAALWCVIAYIIDQREKRIIKQNYE